MRKRVKPIISVLKTKLRRKTEEGLLFDGLKKLVLQIAGQNTENMNMIVTTLKQKLSKARSICVSPSFFLEDDEVNKA